jgi:hypothetical protein
MSREELKEQLSNWSPDMLQGISWGGVASFVKYMLEHFVDLGWTVTAMAVTTVAHHYLKKWLKGK